MLVLTPPDAPYMKGHRNRIYPTDKQKKIIEDHFGCARYIYNTLLRNCEEAYKKYKEAVESQPRVKHTPPSTHWVNLVKEATLLRNNPDTPWLKEVSAVALQEAAKNLAKAFLNFQRRPSYKTYPKRKKKRNHQSYNLQKNAYRLEGDKLWIAKCKTPIKVLLSRPLPSEPTQITISKTPSGEYYVSFLCRFTPEPSHGKGVTGIDLGISSYLTKSDGTKVPNPKNHTKCLRKMKRLQQSLSRKKKGSSNRHKTRIKVAKLHQRITNSTQDFLHKLSTQLVSENQALGVEGLRVSNMAKNHHLARSIQEASWGKFLEMLKYKAKQSQNCTLVVMDPFYPSSRLCSCCGYKNKHLRLKDRQWTCPDCGTNHDRDINAARNIQACAYSNNFGWLPEEAIVHLDRFGRTHYTKCPWTSG